MILINLFGQPGAGKSTLAAMIFAQMKLMGANIELITEYAKDLVWEKRFETLNNQVYILGKQTWRVNRCASQVDFVVTDSPFLLGNLYANGSESFKEAFKTISLELHNKYQTINYFVKRIKPYKQIGRYQSEEVANIIGNKCYKMLQELNIDFSNITSTQKDAEFIAKLALNNFKQ